MRVKIAGIGACIKKGSVTGAVLKDTVVDKAGLDMDVMVQLGENIIINVYLSQVWPI